MADYKSSKCYRHTAPTTESPKTTSWNGHEAVAAFILKTASKDLNPEQFQSFINFRNKWGKTVLIDAAEKNRPEIINLLLDHSADYSLREGWEWGDGMGESKEERDGEVGRKVESHWGCRGGLKGLGLLA